MAFMGSVFLFDGRSSEYFGLRIGYIDTNAINKMMGSFSLDIKEKKLYRRNVPFFFGAEGNPHLEFDISAFTEEELTAQDFEQVQNWLFGRKSYKQFQVVQEDMEHVYFNVIFNSPELVKVGGQIRGFNCRVICDGPYAYRNVAAVNRTYTGDPTNTNEVFYNPSQDGSAYLYPTSVITMTATSNGDLSIVNASDDNREFEFTDLSANEVLTVNNSLGIITSSTGLRRLSKFNKKWLRLVPGANNLTITGNVASISHTFVLPVKSI